MSEESRTPSMAELVARAIGAAVSELHTGVVARVVKFNKAKKTVDVQPVVMWATRDETGKRVVRKQPVIANVPVVFPGGGGFSLRFPVRKGDLCWLAHSEVSMDRWKSKGGADVDPVDDRRHSLSDAVAFVGLCSPGSAGEAAPDDHATLGADGGPKIHMHPGEIRLGSNGATQGVARVGDGVTITAAALDSAIGTYLGLGSSGGVSGTIATGSSTVKG